MPRLTTQAEESNPKRKGYDFRLDNQLYRAAITTNQQMIIESSDVGQENSVNVKQNAEDFTSNIGRVFSRNKFSSGEGLDTAHRADGQPDDVNRFWDSKNVDVFHDAETSYNVGLLYSTDAKSISLREAAVRTKEDIKDLCDTLVELGLLTDKRFNKLNEYNLAELKNKLK